MLPVGILLNFFVLYLSVKLMEKRTPFYVAALIFVVTTYLLTVLMSWFHFWPPVWPLQIVKLLVALPIFYLLDYFEDTIVKWLAIFLIGGGALLLFS